MGFRYIEHRKACELRGARKIALVMDKGNCTIDYLALGSVDVLVESWLVQAG